MADTREDRELTNQQEQFCQIYTTHWNASRAAAEAGYSEKSAGVQGYQLLQNPLIQKRIAELREPALERLGITRERILNELARVAFGDMRGLARWNASGVQFHDSDSISEDDAASIQEVSETVTQNGGSLKIKRYDKVKALELLGKYQKLFADRIEHSGPDGKPIETRNISDEELDAKIEKLNAAKADKSVPSGE